jgi:hypothetical protein
MADAGKVDGGTGEVNIRKRDAVVLILIVYILSMACAYCINVDKKIDIIEIGTRGHLEIFYGYPNTSEDIVMDAINVSCRHSNGKNFIWTKRCEKRLTKLLLYEYMEEQE